MTPSMVFRVCNFVALLAWVLLIFAGRLKSVATVVCRFAIPGALSAVYVGIVLTHWKGHQGGFSSVEDVQKLFADPWLLTAGWVHYLAFDLFLGAWQVRDAQRSGLSHWWTIPCLILTFLFGPAGFLLYLALKTLVLGVSQPGKRTASGLWGG